MTAARLRLRSALLRRLRLRSALPALLVLAHLLPGAANVQVGAGTAWRLYDADMVVLASGATFPAPASARTAGCYLLLFGAAGSSSTLTVTLPVGAQAHGQQRTGAPYPRYVARLR